MTSKRITAGSGIAALLALSACAAPTSAPTPVGVAALPVGAETITPEDMYARVGFLASDALRGRDTPSQGLEAAAAYLVSEYRRLGLEPAGEDGTYYQRYPYPLVALDTASVHFGALQGEDNLMLEYGADFFVLGVLPAQMDGGAPPDMNHAHLTRIGELGEEGLPAADYTGEVPVVSLRGEYDRDWRLAASRARRAAQAAGAAALVLVVGPDFPEETFRELAARSREPERVIPGPAEIPVFYLTHAAGQRIADRPEAHFAATLRVVDEADPPNVAAVLPGSDPELRDEYVILSAHMDHVGVGRPVNGDSIYNGADDDASGTSALVEVAEAMASLPEPPRRSVIFLHVSGEEHGLLGSRWYSDHPTVPLDQIVANVNVDMIGRNSPDSVVVIGKDYSSLGTTVNQAGAAHPELDLVVSDDIWPEERFFFRSDHFNFARKEIPALFFFTGVHEDYHRPSDEVEKLNVDKAARVARLIFYTVQSIADDPQRPEWDPEGLAEVRALTR